MELTIHDSIFEVNRYYLAGVHAHRTGKAWKSCPHRHGSKRYDDWDAGYTNDEEGDHSLEVLGEQQYNDFRKHYDGVAGFCLHN